MNQVEIYIKADEIDHITLAYRKGKGLDAEHAARLIRRYYHEHPAVGKFCASFDPIFSDVESFPEEKLNRILVGIRNILLHDIWEDQPLPDPV